MQDIGDTVKIRGIEYRIDGFGPWGEGKFFGKHTIYLIRLRDGLEFRAWGKSVGSNSKVYEGHGIRHLEK